MIDGLKPYPEYKESGSPWLGTIPAHWSLRNFRTFISRRDERNQPDLPLLSVAREKGVFVRSLTGEDDNHNFIPDDLSNYKVARAGDLVINKMKAWQGSMGISPCDGLVSPAYFVFGFGISNHAFGQKLLRSKPYVAHFAQASDGVRVGQWDLSIAGMRQIPLVVPYDEEQDAIVRFLDHANVRIERAIRAKKRLIALLNEQKQAIIHRAVTRGLDPNVPLKPSGIPWLGDIPMHWDVLRSKYLFREVDDRSATGQETRLSMSQKLGLIPSSEIEVKRLVSESAVGSKICETGDLVLNRLKAHLGVFALASVRGLVSPDYTILRPARAMCPRYFELIYRTPACRVELRKRAKGIVQGFWRLYTDDFYDIRVALPPVPEQERIVKQLDVDLITLNTATARTEREIGLLREYRTRLVADVVTGKLDVRAATRDLPSDANELVTSVSDERAELIEEEELA